MKCVSDIEMCTIQEHVFIWCLMVNLINASCIMLISGHGANSVTCKQSFQQILNIYSVVSRLLNGYQYLHKMHYTTVFFHSEMFMLVTVNINEMFLEQPLQHCIS